MRPFETFVGVDLGGGRGKTTAVALLEKRQGRAAVRLASQRDPEGRPWYDDGLARFLHSLARSRPTVVAIDAPTALPACLRCGRQTCPGTAKCPDPAVAWMRRHSGLSRPGGKPAFSPYTQRVTDLVLQERFGLHREALGTNMGPVTARMQHLLRLLAPDFRPGSNLLEAWPRAVVAALFGSKAAENYRKKPGVWTARALILEALAPDLEFDIWRESALANVHVFDAVLCGYTAFLWARDGWQIPRALSDIAALDGWCWFPPGSPP